MNNINQGKYFLRKFLWRCCLIAFLIVVFSGKGYSEQKFPSKNTLAIYGHGINAYQESLINKFNKISLERDELESFYNNKTTDALKKQVDFDAFCRELDILREELGGFKSSEVMDVLNAVDFSAAIKVDKRKVFIKLSAKYGQGQAVQEFVIEWKASDEWLLDSIYIKTDEHDVIQLGQVFRPNVVNLDM